MELRFSRTIGQSSARQALAQALGTGSVPHAILVYGARGLGQCALLLDIAEILLCHAAGSRPCGVCRGCRERQARSRDNLLALFPLETAQQKSADSRADAVARKLEMLEKCPYGLFLGDREHISIDQVRELRERLAYTEEQGRVRVIPLFWAESMNAPAANALLKILEEPPPGTYFLLACENRSQLLPTILSRCVKLGLHPLDTSELLSAGEKLREWTGEEVSPRLAPLCGGSPGVYLELLQDGGEELLDAAEGFLRAALAGGWMEFSAWVEGNPQGQEMEPCLHLLEFLLRMARNWHRVAAGSTDAIMDLPALGKALEAQGFPAEVARRFEPFARLTDPEPFVRFLESSVTAIRQYARPSVALIGGYLEFEMQAPLRQT